MFTEKDLAEGLNGVADSEEENQEKSVQWLLDMDLTEPEEKLFTVAGSEYNDAGLSAYEAEIAARPLVRGNDRGDDLASYVDEEIVISSEQGSNIYASSDTAEDLDGQGKPEQPMAVDFSRARPSGPAETVFVVDEGTDILGLAADDDIDEKYRSIKRVKRGVDHIAPAAASQNSVKQSTQAVAAPVDSPEVTAQRVADEVALTAAHAAGGADGKSDSRTIENSALTDTTALSAAANPDEDAVVDDSGRDDALHDPTVRDDVASTPQPEDDAAFDRYLLGGEHLHGGDTDPEELIVALPDETLDEEVTADAVIDYQDALYALEDASEVADWAASADLEPAIEEITEAVQARLLLLGLPAGSITADVRWAVDDEAIKHCHADGLAPAQEVCSPLPESLLRLDQHSRDAVYVGLRNTNSNTACNDFFTAELVNMQASEQVSVDVPLQSVVDDLQALGTTDAAPDADIFGEDFAEDIFGDDFVDAFSEQLQGAEVSGSQDIEEAFSGLSQLDDEQDIMFSTAHEVPDDALIPSASTEPAVQHVDEAPLEDVAAALVASGNTLEHNELDAPASVDRPSVEQAVVADQSIAVRAEDSKQPLISDEVNHADGFVPASIDFSFTSQSNAEIFADFLDAFIEEGSEEVEKLERQVGEWEKDIVNEALLADACRTLHTIKGIAKGVGLHRLGTLVHNFETLLEKMPRPAQSEQQHYFHIVNAWLDAVVRGVDFVTEQRADIASELPVQNSATAMSVDVATNSEVALSAATTTPAQDQAEQTDLVDEVPTVTVGETAEREQQTAAAQSPAVAPQFRETSALERKRDKQLADEGAKALAAQQSVRITSEKLDHLLNLTSQAQQLGVRASQNTSRGKRSSAELQARLSSVRTHIRKIADRALLNVNAQPGKSTPNLDALEMDQYSELQEAASILREGVDDLGDLVDVLSRQNMQVEALLKQQSAVISSISSSIQSARVVPVSRLMPGLRRIVRTVSTDLGKVVSFQVLNETGAFDRDHYARLQTILEHMVRNALDHGIESPEQRVAEGKPPGGRITIDVRKSGGDYVVRLADDGRGIDPDAIRHSAYEKGLDVDVDSLSDEEATRLIFHKGFSTASTLSEISGRGVGMDIVMSELLQMGGDVQIQSAIGLGTAFEVRIPSNVSVNGALLVAAAGESYAIPLNGLIAVEQVPVEEFFAAVEEQGMLSIAGLQCEPTYLATLCQGMPLPGRSAWNNFVPVIVAGSEDRHMAIAIDNLEEALELVVRSLGSQFSMVPGVAGAATTAEGEAIVALDLNLLVKSAGDDATVPVAENQSHAATLLALVVDDSRTQRMVATSQLDAVGVETVTAENGLVAIDLLNATHRLPDVILLDVEMPVKDGIETLREIRKSRRYGHLPVIMVTSRTGAKHRALASEAGCNAYMGKPFNFAALVRQINALTGHDLQLS